MPKGYWINTFRSVKDPAKVDAYRKLAGPTMEAAGAKFLVRGGQFENPEGACRSRNVVLEFKDYATALACYNSPEYQAAIKLRTPHSAGDVVIVEGYDGPQPG